MGWNNQTGEWEEDFEGWNDDSAQSLDVPYDAGTGQNDIPDSPPEPEQSFNADDEIRKLEQQYGIGAGETDLANLAGKNPEDRQQYLADLGAQYDKRNNATFSAGGSGGDLDRNNDAKLDPGWKKLDNVGGGRWTKTALQLPQFGGGEFHTNPDGISAADRAQKGSGGGSDSANGSANGSEQSLADILKGLYPDGAFNQDVTNRRVSNASDALNRNRKSQLATNRAALASRGLLSEGEGHESGVEASMMEGLEARLGDSFNSSVNDIYTEEGQAADARMMQALALATGMSMAEAQNVIEMFKASTERELGFGGLALGNKRADNDYTLGQGQLELGQGQLGLGWGNLGLERELGEGGLALGNMSAVNNYNLGLAGHGLDREQFLWETENGDIDRLIELIDQLYGGAGISAGGYA